MTNVSMTIGAPKALHMKSYQGKCGHLRLQDSTGPYHHPLHNKWQFAQAHKGSRGCVAEFCPKVCENDDTKHCQQNYEDVQGYLHIKLASQL